MTDQTKYTDRELLELAAKVASIPIHFLADGLCYHLEMRGNPGFRYWQAWNPLTDDGDALRLAVARHMGVKSNGPTADQDPNCTIILFDAVDCSRRLCQPHEGNPAAATRRAIVRAAAAQIGSAA